MMRRASQRRAFAGYLAAGTPVIVWVTTDWQPPRTSSYTWLLEDTGETYTPYANLHCLVLTGMGETKCKTADPARRTDGG